MSGWGAKRLAKDLLSGLEGDVRVEGDTVTVAYDNAPDNERLLIGGDQRHILRRWRAPTGRRLEGQAVGGYLNRRRARR